MTRKPWSWRPGNDKVTITQSPVTIVMALDLSAIVGIVLMSVGGLMVAWGLVLCYTTKGEYYNADEVQAMVAAEMLEEKRKKKEEEEMFDDIGEITVGKKKRRGPLIAD